MTRLAADFLERTQISDALRESEQRLRGLASIVEFSDDAIVGKNLDGIITSWNKGAERVFGYTAEEAIGHSITIVIPQARHDEEREILTRIRRGEHIDHYVSINIPRNLRSTTAQGEPILGVASPYTNRWPILAPGNVRGVKQLLGAATTNVCGSEGGHSFRRILKCRKPKGISLDFALRWTVSWWVWLYCRGAAIRTGGDAG